MQTMTNTAGGHGKIAARADNEGTVTPAIHKKSEVGLLPMDWKVERLGNLGKFSKGSGIKRDQTIPYGIPCIRYGEIYTRHHDRIKEFISFIPATLTSLCQRLRQGDLLFTGSGETSKEIGKCVAFLGVEEAYAGGDIVILSPDNQSSEYLGYLLNHSSIVEQKVRKAQGDAVVHISAKSLAELQIPLPPLHEQKAIAKALRNMDELIEGLDKLIAKKRGIKQATMQQLLTGKRRLPGFTGEWAAIKLRELGATYGGLSGKSKADFGTGNSLYVTFLNVMTSITLDSREFEKVCIGSTETQNRVQFGDLLFNGSSEIPEEVAMCSLVTTDQTSLYLNSFCFGYRLNNKHFVDRLFLVYFFRSAPGRNLIKSIAQGSTRYNISKRALLELVVTLPSKDEQTAIAKILSDMDAEITTLEARRDKTKALKQGMMQELLTGRIRLV